MRTARTLVIRLVIAAVVGVSAIALALTTLLSPREYRAAVQTYRLTDDPRQIVLHVSLGPGDVLLGSEVREDPEKVVVIVKARDASNAGGEGVSYFVTVTLRDPLGARTVIDGTDLVGLAGHVVPRVP
jgi:hypothetical protein